MSKRFITSDWHLGEDRFKIMNRMDFSTQMEMVEHLQEKHNNMVSPEDLVYVVGDSVYAQTPEFLSEVEGFNGRKILIRGNHDRGISDEKFLEYFEAVVPEGDGIELTVGDIPCWLTHYPTKSRKDFFNLVGHIHGAWKVQLNMINIGVDANHYFPYDLDEAVPFFWKAITEFYDGDVWVAYHEANEPYLNTRGKRTSYSDNMGE